MSDNETKQRVLFKHYDCVVVATRYAVNGAKALHLIGAPGSEYEGEPIATCTVNLPDATIKLSNDEIFVKNYSENEGMFSALVHAGLIEEKPTGIEVSGWVRIPIARLTKLGMSLWDWEGEGQ